MTGKHDLLRNVNESINKEANELRSRLVSADNERKDLRNHIAQLNQAYDTLKQTYQAETQKRSEAEGSTRKIASDQQVLQDHISELEFALGEAEARLASQEQEISDLHEERDATRDQLADAEERVLDLTYRCNSFAEESKAAQLALNKAVSDHGAQLRKLKSDQERQVDLLTSKQGELAHMLDDTKAHYEESLQAAQFKCTTLQKTLSATEDKLHESQLACRELQQMVEMLGGERAVDLQKAAADKKMAADTQDVLNAALLQARRACDEMATRMETEREQAAHEMHLARLSYIQCNERFAEVLSTVQTRAAALNQEVTANRAQMRDLLGQVQLYRKKVAQVGENGTTSLNNLRTELVAAYKTAQTVAASKKEQVEAANDAARRHQLAKEQEVSKGLELEEYVSRLEHEASIAVKRAAIAEKDNALAARKQAMSLEKVTGEKREVEDQLRVALAASKEAADRAKKLEGTVAQLEAMLADYNIKQSSSRQETDSRVAQLSAQLSRTFEERDNMARHSEDLAEQCNALQAENQRHKSDMNNAIAQIEALRRENADIQQKQQQALSSASDAAQQYHTQFKNTQELLKTVQAQRAQLLAQNVSLRNELNQTNS